MSQVTERPAEPRNLDSLESREHARIPASSPGIVYRLPPALNQPGPARPGPARPGASKPTVAHHDGDTRHDGGRPARRDWRTLAGLVVR